MKKISIYSNANILSKHVVAALFLMAITQFNKLIAQPGYVVCDFHQHTTFTDGAFSFDYVMKKNAEYGLNWWANSEHGGGFNRDGRYSGKDLDTIVYWDQYNPNPIIGTYAASSGHQNMWRWQSLCEYSFPALLNIRKQYTSNTIIQGFEWNLPGHEHGSVAILGSQFKKRRPNVNALSEFEYKFDNNDKDTVGGVLRGWVKSKETGHEKTLEAIRWCQQNFARQSWVIPAHPERKNKYNIADFRDMNNAGPDVAFGFESMPGHQKSENRGEYSPSMAYGNATYGGTGIFAAKVGGLWDALLSEGREWWLFASSDFHDTINDFYPGEYQKTYVYTRGSLNPYNIVSGLRSGNSWVVTGDLIDYLQFKIINARNSATMGETLDMYGQTVTIYIKIHDPITPNHNRYSAYNNPLLNHIDLIAGYVTDKISKDSALYNIDSVNTTRVIARFDATGGIIDSKGLISNKWKDLGNGWKEMKITINNVNRNMYFRLRGTNHGLDVANETDGAGNPLSDELMYPNNAVKAFADLWFYSNPIFVKPMKQGKNFKTTEEEIIADDNKQELEVYPNPVNDVLNINNPDQKMLTLSLYNLSGKLIQYKITSDAFIAIKLDHVHPGIYVLKIKNGDETNSYSIIKQ